MFRLNAVTLQEIEQVFSVTDSMGLSREAVTIPLRPAHPGYVRALPNRKFEIGVESEVPTQEWLPELRAMIAQELGR